MYIQSYILSEHTKLYLANLLIPCCFTTATLVQLPWMTEVKPILVALFLRKQPATGLYPYLYVMYCQVTLIMNNFSPRLSKTSKTLDQDDPKLHSTILLNSLNSHQKPREDAQNFTKSGSKR